MYIRFRHFLERRLRTRAAALLCLLLAYGSQALASPLFICSMAGDEESAPLLSKTPHAMGIADPAGHGMEMQGAHDMAGHHNASARDRIPGDCCEQPDCPMMQCLTPHAIVGTTEVLPAIAAMSANAVAAVITYPGIDPGLRFRPPIFH